MRQLLKHWIKPVRGYLTHMSKASGRLTGNVGEFSEPYVVARLLVDGRVPVINRTGEKSGASISICGIKRVEAADEFVYMQRDDDAYRCMVKEVPCEPKSYQQLRELAGALLTEVLTIDEDPERREKGNAFFCPSAEPLLKALSLTTLKAKAGEKSDIVMRIVDPFSVGGVRDAGFTIKSMLSGAPSLTNAGATVFRYHVTCDSVESLADPELEELSGKRLIGKLFALPGFNFNFVSVENSIFRQNLRMIDSLFEPILANALFCSYKVKGGHFPAVIGDPIFMSKLSEVSGYDDDADFFAHKFKDFLKQSALGMQPGKPWFGSNEVTGGAIIVQPDGEVVCLCTDKDTDFRDYLYDNCRFETPSSGDGEDKLCALRKDADGKYWIRLSLQVRFK